MDSNEGKSNVLLNSTESVDKISPMLHSHVNQSEACPKLVLPHVSGQARGAYPTPPQSASPTKQAFAHMGQVNVATPPSPPHGDEAQTPLQNSEYRFVDGSNRSRHRCSSATSHFPNEQTHRPLGTTRAELHVATKSRRRRTMVGADTIDQLDMIGANGIPYHHDGPYDATLLARNLDFNTSPVAATRNTNEEALRATPRQFINDSVRGHRPLQGTAIVPPGVEDQFGDILEYTEGPNINIEMGWRRWVGIEYHPDDIKGKGEPTFTNDRKADRNAHRRVISEGGIEMRDRRSAAEPKRREGLHGDSVFNKELPVSEGLQRAHTTGRRSANVASAIRSRFGSLRKKREDRIEGTRA